MLIDVGYWLAWRFVWTVSPARLPARPSLKSSVGFGCPRIFTLISEKEIILVTERRWTRFQRWNCEINLKKKKKKLQQKEKVVFFFFVFFPSSSLCCKMSHNINTKHPLPVISMSFCCQVTLPAPSTQWRVGLGSGEVSAKHKPRPWGVVGWWRSCRAGERMED